MKFEHDVPYIRAKRDVSANEEGPELIFTTPAPPLINITAEETGNFTEEKSLNVTTEVPLNVTTDVHLSVTSEVPFNVTTEVPHDQEPVKVPVVTQFVTQDDYPTYNMIYSDNMAVEATTLGMVRDGWIAAK